MAARSSREGAIVYRAAGGMVFGVILPNLVMAIPYQIAVPVASGAGLAHMAGVMKRERKPMPVRSLQEREARVRRDFWPKLRRSLARIPFVEDLLSAYFCAIDPATPKRTKAILLG